MKTLWLSLYFHKNTGFWQFNLLDFVIKLYPYYWCDSLHFQDSWNNTYFWRYKGWESPPIPFLLYFTFLLLIYLYVVLIIGSTFFWRVSPLFHTLHKKKYYNVHNLKINEFDNSRNILVHWYKRSRWKYKQNMQHCTWQQQFNKDNSTTASDHVDLTN